MHGFHYNPDAGNAQVDMGMFPENERACEATDEGRGGMGAMLTNVSMICGQCESPAGIMRAWFCFQGGGMPSYGWIRV